MQNKYSGFTPMHWEARYGKLSTLKMLVRNNAIEYIPDIKGFRPIDYSGKFKHDECTKYLIETSLSHIEFSIKDKVLKEMVDRIEEGGFLEKENFDVFKCKELMHSPVF